MLRRAADIIRARNAGTRPARNLDTGKPIQRRWWRTPPRVPIASNISAASRPSIAGEHIDLGGSFAYTRREPLGVVRGIGAWNYPIQIACWKAAPALACGNAMVFKPSETDAAVGLKLAEILQRGRPAATGVFNVVQGAAKPARLLVEHPSVAKVSLTGSVPTGRKVMAAAGAGIKPATMELGGKSPLIVFDDADLDNAVGGAMLGNFYSTGQICSNGTRVFVQRARARRLPRPAGGAHRRRSASAIRSIPTTQMGPLISRRSATRCWATSRPGSEEGATLLAAASVPRLQGLESGFFVEPTVFTEVRDDMRIAREEIFGPVMCVLTSTTRTRSWRAPTTPSSVLRPACSPAISSAAIG